jgi:hypothetical protein
MAHSSSIDRLPEEVRLLIARRRQEDRRTITAIMQELQGLGFAVHRSTLARYTKRLDAIAHAGSRAGMDPVRADLRRCRVALEALCDHFGVPRSTI